MKRVIYYFSGTGNSMRAARVIAGQLGDTTIISMRSDPKDVSAADCDVIGFIYPVYHWTMPAPAVRFIEQLEVNPDAYIFTIAMPGFIVGIACEKLAELLAAKGCSIAYGNVVYSVASYAIVYPPMPFPSLRVPRTEKKLKKIAQEIADRKKRDYPRASAFIKRRREKVMTPYEALQPYADEPFVIKDTCVSCGTCARVCPCHNIELKDGRPGFLHHCANCMACVVNCPKRAIGYEITEEKRKLLGYYAPKTLVVRLMGLPEKRKLYRNPYITTKDMMKDREEV